MSDDETPNADELFQDSDSIEEFTHLLDTTGLVISSVSDGLVIGITAAKLQELAKIAGEDPDQRVVIFVKRPDEEGPEPEVLN